MFTIITFLFVLSILVFVHEFGHFIAAKKAGVRVETFSIGMGPKLLKKVVGETEYCLSAIPLGGYVKMKGENPDEESTGDADELMAKSIPARFSIFFAGPFMNALLAVVLLSLVYFIGIEEPRYLYDPPIIGWIEDESPADKMGLLPGDLILSVGGVKVPVWEQTLVMIGAAGDKLTEIEFEREGERRTIDIKPELIREIGAGYIGIHPRIEAVVGKLTPGMPAEKAGIQPGDKIIRIDDTPIIHWDQMVQFIQTLSEQEIEVDVLRRDKEITMSLSPQSQGDRLLIGIQLQQQMVLRKYGCVESVVKGTKRCWELTTMTFDLLRRLLTRQASAKSIGGPIMIAQMSGAVAKQGLSELLSFMALISLSLGIFNLLPIPVLDGGHIFLLFVEFINRKPLSMKKRELAQKIGLFILIPLFLFVFYNDIVRLVGSW